MKNDRTKNIIIGLLVIIIICLLVVIGLIVSEKISFNSATDEVNNKVGEEVTENNQSDFSTITYQFGDEVNLSQLSNVDDFNVDGTSEDFSKWNVLSDDGDYVTLYSSEIWSKVSNVNGVDYSNIFTKYQVDLGTDGTIRGLNEEDLKLLGCDIETKSCSNSPDWAGYSLTQVIDGSNLLIFYGNADFVDDNTILGILQSQDALVYYRPVIKILKDNIK